MKISETSRKLAEDYSYITGHQLYRELKNINRHEFTNTFDHSVRVALLASKISNKIGANIEGTIRASLLHDFCLVNKHDNDEHEGIYLFYHPKEAAKNASYFELTKEEENAILSHMFPFAKLPTSKVGWSITIADKVVAVYEGTYGLRCLAASMKGVWRRVAFFS